MLSASDILFKTTTPEEASYPRRGLTNPICFASAEVRSKENIIGRL